ncbi:DUF2486 family protein [Burkholderia sp. 22PA0106]|uniref:DUF2486 family protein n=1 Tax=Burkholderia sp. 22PA0106 TaxID=3237371 RepID=UPI0039C0F53E
MPDAHNAFDIPVLTDVLVPGKAALARATPRPDVPPHATDLPDHPPDVAPGVAASGLPAVDAGRPLATAYDAPADAAGADALPASRLAPADGERGEEAAPLAVGGLDASAAAFMATEPESVPQELAAEPQPLESHRATDPVEPTQAEAPFVAHEPESVPQELAAEPQPLESHRATDPVEPTQAEAPFAAHEPESVPQELAAEPQPLEPHRATDPVEPTQAEAPFAAHEPESVPQELAAEPQPLEPHQATESVEPTQAEAPFAAPESEPASHEPATEPQPPIPPASGAQAESQPSEPAALTQPEAAFASPEPAVPAEFAAIPEPLALHEPTDVSEPTPAEARFVATEPAVPQELAATPEPLPVHEPEPSAAQATLPSVIHDDEHDIPDGGPLAYALNLEDDRATSAPAAQTEAAASDLANRTESARQRADALPPPAFAQLTPFDAATPVPSRFTDVETPLPAELRHSESVVVPQPPPVKIDSRRIAERLQGRVSAYLSGEGRELIDARSREVVQQHAAWLVGEVSQQVVSALAPEIERWVSEAVEEAIAHRNAPTSEH